MINAGFLPAMNAPQSSESSESSPLQRVMSGRWDPLPAGIPGVELREFVSARCGAQGISTGTGTFQPGAGLPWHKHTVSEAVTVLAGEASCSVEGRTYRLRQFDCIHIPAGTAHETRNASASEPLVAQWAFAAPVPSRELVEPVAPTEDRAFADPVEGVPEHIVRLSGAPHYELSSGTRFCDLFARRTGAVGFRGGYGEFSPGSSVSYRVHDCDESITIITGEAVCEVAGERYRLSGYDTLFVPHGRQHRFFNESEDPMAMIWVRAGS